MWKFLMKGAAALTFAGGAQALTIDFEPDRTVPGAVEVDGLNGEQNAVVNLPFSDMTIIADTFSVLTQTGLVGTLERDNRQLATITQNNEGLGVSNTIFEDPDIDDIFRNDIVFFDFNPSVFFDSIRFELVTNGIDDFLFAQLNETTGVYDFEIFDVPNSDGVDDGSPADESTFAFSAPVFGSSFGIGVEPGGEFNLWTHDFGDRFRVSQINVIPLPAAAWLLLAASGGLIAAKRRTNKA